MAKDKTHVCKVCGIRTVPTRRMTCLVCLTAEHDFLAEGERLGLPASVIKRELRKFRKNRRGK